ncbi:MAG: Fe-S-containing protein, partial [Thermodesulfovibrionales bacterium]
KINTFFQKDEGAFIVRSVVASAALLFFLPDYIGSVFFLRDLAAIKNAALMAYVSFFIGLLPLAALFLFAGKVTKPSRIGAFFDLPQMLLFLSMVKLLMGGTKGIAEISLVPSVQRGLMKFVHDIIHQIFVILMVPDHPLLKTTVWDFIAIFFGPNFASVAALFLLLLLPLLFVYRSLSRPLPEDGALTGAKRRRTRDFLLSDRRKKALPVLCFISLILFSWFSESGESVSRLYDPVSKPVVNDRGTVLIPLHDPTMDLMDGMLHKFSLAHKEETIRIIVIRKANRDLTVCLDACEVCPPKGYGQREDHVVCIYCNTPIPVDTLGQPGGCNPIALRFSVDEKFIRIETGEILKKWEDVKTGKGKETGK